jgi:hypothetical protein
MKTLLARLGSRPVVLEVTRVQVSLIRDLVVDENTLQPGLKKHTPCID